MAKPNEQNDPHKDVPPKHRSRVRLRDEADLGPGGLMGQSVDNEPTEHPDDDA